jgi:predicted nucleic acid-binding protein
MRTVSASEAKQGLSSIIDAAAFEPIVMRRQKRDVAVMLSMREYERLTELNNAEFQHYCDAVAAKGNRFLAVATNDPADAIITGDADLLVLHPFQDIPILSPSEFLKRF